MLLNEELEKKLNQQMTNEFSSALFYKNIAGFYDDKYLPGFGIFFNKKYKEELDHAQKFYDYINERDGRAIISSISEEKIKLNKEDLVSPFYDSLKHEQQVTSYIYELYEEAKKIKDYSTEDFLKWFIREQNEEEGEFLELIARIELVKDCGDGIYRMDEYLSKKAGDVK